MIIIIITITLGHMVTWDVSITVYISWVLGFAGILLLPYDLSVAEVLSHISFIITNF